MLSTLYKSSDTHTISTESVTDGIPDSDAVTLPDRTADLHSQNSSAAMTEAADEGADPLATKEPDSAVVVSITGEPTEDLIKKDVREITIYGSFSLADSEFALCAQSIQEVVNEPEAYSPIPLAPSYLLGVFNLRGSIVPVIDLRAVFNLDYQEGNEEGRKVAIVEHGELCLGLLFDSTGEVFNANDEHRCLFEDRGDNGGDQIISGVFKMDGGKRIVQILDVCATLKLDKVPQSVNLAGQRQIRKRGKRRQCISFRVGTSCCALDITAIREIVNIGEIENKVLAGGLCIGAIDLRGDTVPIVDFSLLLGYQPTDIDHMKLSDSRRVIVMNFRDNLVGLLVDSIQNIVGYFDDELIEFPILVDKKRAMFNGCVPANTDRDHAILLKHDEILSRDELADITRGHSQLFNDSKETTIREQRGSLDRKTLLTFSLRERYGIDIRDVKEVINYPSDLIQTPNMSANVRGMVNLRGELVAVIDTHKLYSMEASEPAEVSKVLIYENQGTKYGLVVDSVDSIVPFSAADVVNVPSVIYRDFEGTIDQDVKEAIMLKNREDDVTVCILDLDAVSRRTNA